MGKYSLIASLGHGGMANVYLALMAGPAGFNKLFVIKALREDIRASAEEFVAMFLDEARLAARLSHPNVVQTYEVGEYEGRYYIAMEYLEGQSLRTVQRRLAPQGLPLDEELRVIAQTAHGLHYAHGLNAFDGEPLGVVHRDVSPQNVFLNYDGQVKLLDFGIAKTRDAMHLTKVGVIKGKLDYIAPEQIRGEAVDARADIFALGAMMWEAIAGRRFAGGPNVADVTKVHRRVNGGEPKLREFATGVPDVLVTICERAVALNPADRYGSALDFAEDIEKYLQSAGLNPTAKSLAERISPPFAIEREKMRRLIDQQIRTATRRGGVRLGQGTGNLPRVGARYPRADSGVHPRVGLTDSGNVDLSDESYPSVERLHARHSGTGVPSAPLPEARPGVPRAVLVTSVTAAVALVALFVTRPDEVPAAVAIAPHRALNRAPTSAQPVASPGPKELPTASDLLPRVSTVHVKIDVVPDNARVTLDGAILPRVPFDAQVARDTAFHHLDVTADGYAPVKQAIQFDKDCELKIVLEREQPLVAPTPLKRNVRRHDGDHTGVTVPRKSGLAPVAEPPPTDQMPGSDLSDLTAHRRVHPSIDLDDPYKED